MMTFKLHRKWWRSDVGRTETQKKQIIAAAAAATSEQLRLTLQPLKKELKTHTIAVLSSLLLLQTSKSKFKLLKLAVKHLN